MKKRDPLLNYIVALLMRGDSPVKLTKAELQKARHRNFSITLGKDYVQLALLKGTPSIMPFEQRKD
jgi:hypothetical protein